MAAQFKILNPCPKRWTDLRGDGRERHCDSCGEPVHAIEQYTPEEWDRVWRESNGHVCGFLAGESAPEPRSRRAVLAGALLTAISPLMAQTGRVRVRVTDVTGAGIGLGEVSLLGADGNATRTVRTNERGEAALTELPMGDCRLAVWAVGFKMRPVTVTIRNSDEVKVDTMLEVGEVGSFIEVTQPVKVSPGPSPTATSPMAQTGRVRLRVSDVAGAAIPSAKVALLKSDGNVGRTVLTNEEGVVGLADLAVGDCRLTVSALGFQERTVTVTVRSGGEKKVDTVLEVKDLGGMRVEPAKRRRGWWIFR